MHDSVTYKIVPGNVMSGDTESENEIEHLQLSPIRTGERHIRKAKKKKSRTEMRRG